MTAPSNPKDLSNAQTVPVQDESVSTLVRLLDTYLAELQAGGKPDPAKLLADHPHLAAQLEPALAGLELIHAGQTKPTPVRLGDFEIKREIGRGGMGIVYEAEQLSLKRRVALKILRYGAVADVQAMQRFQREAETVAGLHHTNIVPIFAIGTQDDTPYYAMQFIEGQSLAEIAAAAVADGSPTPATQVADWGLQAAEALNHAHARGVIHRDIKPSNLIRDRDGRIWLTDFGLAKRAEDVSLSLTGALLGTPRYMSPEQASSLSRPVDHRTDIYSLGATLYELAAGQPIFRADSPDKILTQILTVEPPPPRKVNPNLPRDLETIILKCLAKDPHRRYHNAQDLATDLRAHGEGRAIHARRPAWPERAARWVRKHKRTVAIASASAATAVGLVIGTLLAAQHHRQAQLGQFTLTTSGPRLVGEIINSQGESVLPGFPVPTPNPISVPAGQYQLRLSAAGLLSETWPLQIDRGTQQNWPVELNRHFLWPPIDLPPASSPEMARIADDQHEYLSLLLHLSDDNHRETHVRLINGLTGLPIWKDDFVITSATKPANTPESEWLALLQPSSTLLNGTDTRLLLPAPDLDRDSIPDLVWSSRTSPSLLAISGATGQMLWLHRNSSIITNVDTTAASLAEPGLGAVVGYPISADVNHDDVPDIITAFTTVGDTLKLPNGKTERTPASSWITAISGRDGRRLWNRSVKDLWLIYTYSSEGTAKFNSLVRFTLLPSPDRLLFLHNNTLFCLNVADGQDAQAPIPLSFTPALAPVLTSRKDTALILENQTNSLILHALDLAKGSDKWSHPFRPPNSSDPIGADYTRWFHLVDLDHDGQDKVVLTSVPSPKVGNSLDLEAIQAATGSLKWRVQISGPLQGRVRTLAGPDLNHDGSAELFIARLSTVETQPITQVQAVSGANGHTLWSWQQPHSGHMAIPDSTAPLSWWNGAADPLLIVPVLNASGGQAISYFLSASTGKLSHLLPEVPHPQPIDLNHDGLADLLHLTGCRITALQGLRQGGWSRLGAWTPAADFNRDGFTDLISPQGVVRSGHDQSVLWQLPDAGTYVENILTPPLPLGDLNGDSIPDFIRWEQIDRTRSGNTLRAYSGRNGQLLWTASKFNPGHGSGSASSSLWSSRYPTVRWTDLDGDQRPELIVLHSREHSGTALSALSGQDAHVLWTLPVLRGAFLPVPSPVDQPFADLNNDHVLDPVLWIPGNTEKDPVQLGAFDGRNGQPLWVSSSMSAPTQNRAAWPQPLARDLDQDGFPEVMAVVASDYKRNGYECQLLVGDGRTGEIRWSWNWRTGFPNFLPPLTVRFAHDSASTLCLGVSEMTGARLVCFAPDGTIVHDRPLGKVRGDMQPTARHLWRALQFNDTGLLLFLDGDELCAWNGTAIVWKWPVDPNAATLPFADEKSVVIWSVNSLFGLDPMIGRAQWRSEVDAKPQPYNPIGNDVFRLTAGDASAPPWLLYQRGSPNADTWATVCHPARLAQADGLYR